MVVQGDKQMARTTKPTKAPPTPGFAIEIKDDTELGLAILVVVIAPGTEVPGRRDIAPAAWVGSLSLPC